jgi:putative endonuclease
MKVTLGGHAGDFNMRKRISWGHQDVQVAIAREKQIQRWRRDKKVALIEKVNPRWQDLAENWGREMRFRGQSLGRTP